jgi:hypothetical protein
MRLPNQFVKKITDFRVCFVYHAQMQGVQLQEAHRLFDSVPIDIASAICFQDAFTDIWRYDYGSPTISLSGGQHIIGTPHFPEVRVLVSVMRFAHTILPKVRLDNYLARLANRKKHPDVLAEFQPLMHRSNLTGIENEVPGKGDKRIDWMIPDEGQPPLLIEVKSRIRDLIESLESLEFAQSLGVNVIPAPHHDPGIMFRSTMEKFKVSRANEALQCVWIAAHLKQERNETQQTFQRLATGRLHVVVFGGWTREASLIGERPEDIQAVAARLNLVLSEQYFFVRD